MSSNLIARISCISFNHAEYFWKCLNRVLIQQTNFSFEIVIHDETSPEAII
jgi:hypothetical protein